MIIVRWADEDDMRERAKLRRVFDSPESTRCEVEDWMTRNTSYDPRDYVQRAICIAEQAESEEMVAIGIVDALLECWVIQQFFVRRSAEGQNLEYLMADFIAEHTPADRCIIAVVLDTDKEQNDMLRDAGYRATDTFVCGGKRWFTLARQGEGGGVEC